MLRKEKLNQDFEYNNQKLIKGSSNFSRKMNALLKKHLINKSHKKNCNGLHTVFHLTRDGRFLAVWFCKDFDTPRQFRNIDRGDLYFYTD